MTTTPHTAAASVAANNCTILPDGSAFAVASFPLPKDHWLYAPREYDVDAENPKELPSPILTHALRAEVVSAIRYAIRGATMCGKETDFDPDALVQNAVYALCGPYGSAALAAPAQAATAKQSPHPEYDKGFSDGWNRCEERQAAAPVGMEPVYQIGQPFPFDPENTWRDASKDAYDVCIPSKRRIIYAAAQVQAMLAAVPRNAPLYSPDDVAFPVQRSAEGADVPPELASIAKQASIAAAEVAAPSGAAREPLTEEQMHKDLAALCKRTFNARIGKACSNCDGGTYQSDNKGYGQFHRCNKCRYVPMWGEDGRELGAPIAATQKGGQHGTD